MWHFCSTSNTTHTQTLPQGTGMVNVVSLDNAFINYYNSNSKTFKTWHYMYSSRTVQVNTSSVSEFHLQSPRAVQRGSYNT